MEIDGLKAIDPVNDQEIPIWVSDYVLMSYGTGAIMAVPAHDTRDWEFAKKFNLPIVEVVAGGEDVQKEAPISQNFFPIADLFLIFIEHRMLRRNNHISRAKQRIRPRGINGKLLLLTCNWKIHLRSLALSNPVLLRNFHPFNIIYVFQQNAGI